MATEIYNTMRFFLGLTLLLGGLSCHTLREWRALRQVDFYLDRIDEVYLAGINLSTIQQYEDLKASQIAQLSLALAQGTLPLRFRLYVVAVNPRENHVTARLERLEWTLRLDERPLLSGIIDQTYRLPPGEPKSIPVDIELDLLDVFEKNLRDLVELALALSGTEGVTKRVSLTAKPFVQTPFGPLSYPQPMLILSRDVGTTP